MRKTFRLAALIAAAAMAAVSCQMDIDRDINITDTTPSGTRSITINAAMAKGQADTKVTLYRGGYDTFFPFWQPGDKMMAVVGDINDVFKQGQEFYAAELTNMAQDIEYYATFQGTFNHMPQDYYGVHRLGGYFPAEGYAGLSYDYDDSRDTYQWFWRIGVPATQYAEASNVDPKSYLLVSKPTEVDFSAQDITLDNLMFYRPMCVLAFDLAGVGMGETVKSLTFAPTKKALSGILLISDTGEVRGMTSDAYFPCGHSITVDYTNHPWQIGSTQQTDSGEIVGNLALMSVAPGVIKASEKFTLQLTTDKYRYELVNSFTSDFEMKSGGIRVIKWTLKDVERHPLIQPQSIKWETSTASNVTECSIVISHEREVVQGEIPHLVGAKTTVVYESSNPEVAYLNADGALVCNYPGITRIKAKAAAGETETEAWSEATAEFTLNVTSGYDEEIIWKQEPQGGIHLCINDGTYTPDEFFTSSEAQWGIGYDFSKQGIVEVCYDNSGLQPYSGIKAVNPGEVDVTVYSILDPTRKHTYHLIVDYYRAPDNLGGYYMHIPIDRPSVRSGRTYYYSHIVSNQRNADGSPRGDISFHNSEKYRGSINLNVLFGAANQSILLPTYIDEEAFMDCTELTDIRVCDYTVWIEPRAFCNCTSLERIVFGEKTQAVGDAAFHGCTNLSEIVTDDCPYFTFRDGILYDIDRLANTLRDVIWVPECYSGTTLTFDPQATGIASYAVNQVRNVGEIVIPGNIQYIRSNNFNGLNRLKGITMPWNNPAGVSVDSDNSDTYFQNLGVEMTTIPSLRVPAGSAAAYRSHTFWGGHETSGHYTIAETSNGNITDIGSGSDYNW